MCVVIFWGYLKMGEICGIYWIKCDILLWDKFSGDIFCPDTATIEEHVQEDK